VEALLRFEELLAARLLADAHAPRCVLRFAAHVIERLEPTGQQCLHGLGLLPDHARAHREEIDDLARDPRAVDERRCTRTQKLGAIRVERDGCIDVALFQG